MGKWYLLLCVGVLMVVSIGCDGQAGRSVAVNSEIAGQEMVRFVGLDRPSLLQLRESVPVNYYTPYR